MDTYEHTFWQASSGRKKIVSAGNSAIILSPVVVLRADIMACCQEKCQEMFTWGDCWVPVGEQGELFSPPLWHIKPNIHAAGLRVAFKTCQTCQCRGTFIKQNNINVPGDRIRPPDTDLSLYFLHDWDVHPPMHPFFVFHWVFSLKTDRGSKTRKDMTQKTKWNQTE